MLPGYATRGAIHVAGAAVFVLCTPDDPLPVDGLLTLMGLYAAALAAARTVIRVQAIR